MAFTISLGIDSNLDLVGLPDANILVLVHTDEISDAT